MKERISFEEMRDIICTDQRGQVVDSLIAVEMGLRDYMACWEAHLDVLEDADPECADTMAITLFLAEIGEVIGFEEIDFDRLLGTNV